MATSKNALKCSICGKSRNEVEILISGQFGNICDTCTEQSMTVLLENKDVDLDFDEDIRDPKKGLPKLQTKKPIEIKAFLDEYIIGQDDAKKAMAVGVYNHYKRLLFKDKKQDEVEIDKSNMVFVGETGTGKTLIARTIAKLLNVPFAIVDATLFTEAGYVGEDVESILTRLLQTCDYNVASAERGIVYIDEIDKISRKGDNPSLTRDIKEGVQQALLKLLEGSEVMVPPQGGRKHPEQKMIKVDTRHILFICGGSFEGIDKIISRRIQTNAIGFSASRNKQEDIKENLLQYVNAQDLKTFGLIPELIGRLPVVTYLKPLDKYTLKRILTEPKNSLEKQYKKLFSLEDITLTINDDVYDFIVEKAVEFKLGARGLRGIFETLLTDAMYELPSSNEKSFTLTLDYALEKFSKSKVYKLHSA
jgi:ATP-dependent Clp protease ATP-binding subunit ClpX